MKFLCRLLGHAQPDNDSAPFWAMRELIWRCPRCKQFTWERKR
jgi:hypothetical protein